MREPKRIYLSGPISGLDAEVAFENFETAEETVRRYFPKAEIINPLKRNGAEDSENRWEDFMIRDLADLKTCDTIALLDVGGYSMGCEIEKLFAEKMGLNKFDLDRGVFIQRLINFEENGERD